MIRLRPRHLALALGVLFAPGAALAQQAAATADLAPRVDSLFARWSTPESPGCAVGVSHDGRTVLTRAYGQADLEHDVANAPATVFEAGSVSKQFTAAAIALLARRGVLSLDDDVRKWVPELPDYGATITIRRLLDHTSGLRDWGTIVGVAGWPRGTRAHTHAHVLDVLRRQRALNYEPGAEYSYTNSGYNLLAMIVERASGTSFAEFSRREIFEPLGMTRTQWRDDYTRVVEDRATAYRPAPGGGWRIDMPFENVHGNGGLLTTVDDLLRWNEALYHDRLGGHGFAAEMQRRGRLTSGREIAYALGLFVGDYRGVPEVSHSGATAGYRAYLARYPEQRLSVAVLCNAANANPTQLAHRTAELLLGDAVAPPDSAVRGVTLPDSVLAARAGVYRSALTWEPVRLFVRDGRLQAQGVGLLTPLSPTLFAGGGARVQFTLDARGRTTLLQVLQPDGDTVRFLPVPTWSPSPAELAAFAGKYDSDEAEVSFTVAVDSGELLLRRRPDDVIRLAPVYPDAFVVAGNNATGLGIVRFVRDAQGRVAELSLGLARVRDLRFRRGR